MKMAKKSVTVGIPAHNEEKNILPLLESLIKQEGENFILKEIIVTCDGTTDKTATLVTDFATSNPIVKLVNDGKRKGKSGRLNEFYKSIENEILITIDADVTINDSTIIHDIVACFDDSKIGLVGINDAPLPGKTFIGKSLAAYEEFWTETVNRINNGRSVHAHPGHVSAGSRDFLSQVSIPENIIADDHFLYFECLRLGFEFRSCRSCHGYIKVPETFDDFMRQSTRFSSSADGIKEYFKEAAEAYKVPASAKLIAYLVVGTKQPLYLVGALVLHFLQRILAKKYTFPAEGRMWTQIQSSK